ncbi:Nucleoid-associated protein YgaU, contains BON and LysM domains [Lachnospiraceae bacterium]|nr:Nucleoid-associated protein YgaU, contains BON and LysM domains [Lachnospiraceae bacterium]
MFVGSGNLNMNTPVKKMKITNMITKKNFYVEYNPTTYQLTKNAEFGMDPALDSDAPAVQFTYGTVETLSMQLFFDTFSTGVKNAPSVSEGVELEANKRINSVAKFFDVRKMTDKVYNLMQIEPSAHIPPLVKIEWSSLQFEGFLKSCNVNLTKFSDLGIPVRATMDCVFFRFMKVNAKVKTNPFGSPDTAKFRTVEEGQSLWSFAASEYGDPDQWRAIAGANKISNPRTLRSGELIRVPAIE